MPVILITIIGFLVVFTTTAVVLVRVVSGASRRERLAIVTGAQKVAQVATVTRKPASPARDPLPALSEALARTEQWDKIQLELLRAGLLLRPSEAFLLSMISGFTGLMVGWMLSGKLIHGILLAGLGLVGPYIYMKQRASRRQAQLTAQLPDALDMLSAAMRSGYALTRGFQVIASQMHPPIAEEIKRTLQEVQVGIPVTEALDGLLTRTGSYDLELVVAAMQTQLTMGGNLAEVLDNISDMIRERVRLQGEINAATSEGRMSASILVAMPIVMAVVISIINPGYLDPLFTEKLGIMMLLGAGLLMLSGMVIIKKMLDIDI